LTFLRTPQEMAEADDVNDFKPESENEESERAEDEKEGSEADHEESDS
jgi:hypothetical protein